MTLGDAFDVPFSISVGCEWSGAGGIASVSLLSSGLARAEQIKMQNAPTESRLRELAFGRVREVFGTAR